MAKNVVITVLLIIIFSAGAYLYGSGKWVVIFNQPTPTPTAQGTPVPESTTSPTAAPTTIPTSSPTPTVSAEDQIRQALATKHSKSVADTDISINEITATHASGVVKFAGEIAGGWFLAAKTTMSWQIVADGNGTISCLDIDPFNFPTTMVPECWDDTTQTLIVR